jgi:hypothetical protein
MPTFAVVATQFVIHRSRYRALHVPLVPAEEQAF